MAWSPTAEQLLNLEGVRRRADRFRFELWSAGYKAGELHPDAARAPTVSVDTSRPVVRALTGLHLPAGDLDQVNTVRDEVRVFMVLQDGTEYALGRFFWGDQSRPLRPWGPESSSTLVDESFRLDHGLDRSLGWGEGGTTIVIAVYLAGSVLPLSQVSYDASAAVLSSPVSYDPGANRLRIISDLVALLGYLPPHADRNGQLWLREPPDLTAEPELRYPPGPRVWADTIVESDDLLEAPNRFVVYDSSGEKGPIGGHYDLPPGAPHSIAARGGVVVPMVESRQGLESPAAAAKAARALAISSGTAYEWVEWESPADPRHDVWDPVSFMGATYLETAWSIECRSGGPMTHTARRVYPT